MPENEILSLYADGAPLWEIAALTGETPRKILYVLKRKRIITRREYSFEEIKQIKKRLNTKIPIRGPIDENNIPLGLDKWCLYYGLELEQSVEEILAGKGKAAELFHEDAENWRRINAEIRKREQQRLHEQYEEEGYPLERIKDILYDHKCLKGKNKNQIFYEPDGNYWLRMTAKSTDRKLRNAFSSLIHSLRGILCSPSINLDSYVVDTCKNDYDYHPQLIVHVSVIVFDLNKDRLVTTVKEWASKYCYVLDDFAFGMSEVSYIPDVSMNLAGLIENKLEEGER